MDSETHWHYGTYMVTNDPLEVASAFSALAALCNLAIAILKQCAWTNIAAANRHHHKDARRCLATFGLTAGQQDP